MGEVSLQPIEELECEPNRNSDLGLLMKMIGDCMAKRGNAHFKEQGITMGQAHVLMAIHNSEGETASFKELERLFGVAQATMAGILSRMEEKGFIGIAVDPNDRRAKRVSLTAKGLDICESTEQGIAEGERMMVSRLAEGEEDQLRDLLLKVYEAVRAQ